VGGDRNDAVEITVEPRDDPQQRGLPAPGGPDQRGDLPAAEAEHKPAEHLQVPAGGSAKRLLPDVDVKPASDASGRYVVQAAAPETFGQDARDVEQLERNADLETDAVRTPEQLDNEHDLPNQRQAGAGGGGEVGPSCGNMTCRRRVHAPMRNTCAISSRAWSSERAPSRTKFVQRHCRDRRGLRQPAQT
jgi:hypothetical protein